jgi:hypothetical protein
MRKRTIFCVSVLASAAACSSGGGGSTSAGVASSAAPAAPQPVAAFTSGAAPASVAGLSFNCGAADCPATSVVGSGGGGTVTLGTAANGNQTMTLSIAQGGASINHTFDFGANGANVITLSNDPGVSNGWGGFFDLNDGPDTHGNSFDVKFAGSADPNHSLTYVSFGTWTQGNTDPLAQGGIGVFAAGNETPVGNLPATGQATYSGTTIGQGSLNGMAASMTGSVAATADFAARTVNGTMNAFVFGDQLGADQGFWNTLAFGTAIAPGTSHFAGTINAPAVTRGTPTSVGTPAITTGVMSGAISGSLYGPAANEIGGVFNLAGGTNSMLGAFGAHH